MHGSLRASLSKFNTMQEIGRFLDVAPGVVSKLREMSQYTRGRCANMGYSRKVLDHFTNPRNVGIR